jgi:hypothetical protein
VDQAGGGFLRVQVKSTIFREGAGFSCTLKNSRGPYRSNVFDFVAAYVIPEDLWYILPAKKIKGMWSVGLHPELENAKYAAYKDAWHLLRRKPREKSVVPRIEACAAEWPSGFEVRRSSQR